MGSSRRAAPSVALVLWVQKRLLNLCWVAVALLGLAFDDAQAEPVRPTCSEDEHPLVERFVVVLPGVDPQFAERVRQAIAVVPGAIIGRLHGAGWRCIVTPDLVSYAPQLAGLRPRGWPPGVTWAQVDAVHLPEEKKVVVAQWRQNAHGQRVASHRVPGAVWHELGHAWDVYVRERAKQMPSLTSECHADAPEFSRAWHNDVITLKQARGEETWGYYLQDGVRGRQEVFAEAFAVGLGAGSDELLGEKFTTGFPAACRIVQQWLDRLGP